MNLIEIISKPVTSSRLLIHPVAHSFGWTPRIVRQPFSRRHPDSGCAVCWRPAGVSGLRRGVTSRLHLRIALRRFGTEMHRNEEFEPPAITVIIAPRIRMSSPLGVLFDLFVPFLPQPRLALCNGSECMHSPGYGIIIDKQADCHLRQGAPPVLGQRGPPDVADGTKGSRV